MGTTRRRDPKGKYANLTPPEWTELALGFHWNTSAFATAADRRAAWQAHRDRLMDRSRPGIRPAAWWWLEVGREPPRSSDRQRIATGTPTPGWEPPEVVLAGMGELTPAEVDHFRDHLDHPRPDLAAVAAAVIDAVTDPPGHPGSNGASPSALHPDAADGPVSELRP